MKRIVKCGLVFALVLTFGAASLVDAADRKRDRKRDGSCLNSMLDESMESLAAVQKKDRKRDGSCLNSASDEGTLSLGANQKRTKDRKRDGSCRV
jgi:hypothetical protein